MKPRKNTSASSLRSSKNFGSKVQPDILYKQLVEHMNEAVWMGDDRERTVYANPKFCAMVGYSLKEILGEESYIFWDEESGNRVRNVNENDRKKGVSSSYEGNLKTRDGRLVPVLLSGTPLPDGGTIGIITDLTELKKKEAAERVLTSAVEHASDGILIFNRDGKITSWNKGAKVIFGYKKDEISGESITQIFENQSVDELFQSAVNVYQLETVGYHKNRIPIHISATLTPLFEGDMVKTNKHRSAGAAHAGAARESASSSRVVPAPSQLLMIARDITSQKKFEEEMSLRYLKIQEAYNRFGSIRRQMDYIFEMLHLVSSHHDKKHIADFVVSSIIMLTHVDACVLRVKNPHRNTLDLVSLFGLSSDWESKSKIEYRGSLVEKSFTVRHPLKIIDVTKEPRYQSAYLAKKNNVCSLLLIPLTFRSQVVGSLSLYTRPDKKLEIFENDFIEQYAKLIELIVGTMLVE